MPRLPRTIDQRPASDPAAPSTGGDSPSSFLALQLLTAVPNYHGDVKNQLQHNLDARISAGVR